MTIHRLILVITLAIAGVSVSSGTVMVPDSIGKLELDGRWSFLDDPDQALVLSDAIAAHAAGAFIPLSRALGRGYTASASWLAIDLENPSVVSRDFILRLDPQMLDHVDVYWQFGADGSSTSSYRHHALGDHVAAADKPMALPGMGVPLHLNAQSVQRVFVRIQTTSSHLLGSSLVSKERYEQDGIANLVWQSAYQGIALWVALVTFLQAYRLRDMTHGLYGLLPLGLCLNSIGTEGTVFVFAAPIAHRINDGLVGASMFLCFGGLSLFAILMFQARTNHPFWYRYLQALVFLSLLDFLGSGTVWYGKIASIVMAVGFFLWIFLAWASFRLMAGPERRLGQLMLLAFMLPLASAAIVMLRYLGIVPQSGLIQGLIPATSLVHMVFMTLALSERLAQMEAAYSHAIQEALMETEHREEMEKLVAMLTHEIRSPISVIKASTQSLQILEQATSGERDKRYRRIERSIHRLSMLMDLTEHHAGRENAQLGTLTQPFDPLVTTRMIIGWLDDRDQSRLTLDVQGQIPELKGVERMLCFAWMNLVDNACKFSARDDPIRITLAQGTRHGLPGLYWRIEDQGPGIPLGHEERIFEKYWRAGEINNAPGMGLGLYLARNIAQRHGGCLYAETGRLKGAGFTCWLPLRPHEEGNP